MVSLVSVILSVTFLLNTVEPDERSVDLNEVSGIHPDILCEGLLYDLADYSYAFADAEIESEINGVALASIAAIESNWGRSKLAQEKNNLFGWKDSSGEYMSFSSPEECILYVGRKIKELYLSEDGPYYQGDTDLYTICTLYAGAENWADEIVKVYIDILNRISEYYDGACL